MTTLVKASCHCGRNAFKVPFKTASLPKSAAMCHCNICRHCTGSMSVVDPQIDGQPLSIDSTEEKLIPGDLSNLTAYHSSSRLTRYFCSTCSAHMFFQANMQGDTPSGWTVMWGVLEKTDGIIKIEKHILVADTLDGGIADHFVGSEDKPIKRLKDWKDDESEENVLPLGWRASEGAYKNAETIPIYCHCRSVNFKLTRATKLSDNPADYWLVAGKEATDPIRFMSGHCLCNSCRLSSGGQIQSWTIVPNENVVDPATNAPIDLVNPDKRPKSLKQYLSSDGKRRESCATCGATVFWWRDMKEGESPHIDLATALIDEVAAGGARAESWVCWYHRLIFSEFAVSKETATILAEGVKAAVPQPAA